MATDSPGDDAPRETPRSFGANFSRGLVLGLVVWGASFAGPAIVLREHIDARRLVVGVIAVLLLSACIGLRVACLTGQQGILPRLAIGTALGIPLGACLGVALPLLLNPAPPVMSGLLFVLASTAACAVGSGARAIFHDD